MADEHGSGGAFYGRRKGHRLRPAQQARRETLLPQLRIDPTRDCADPAGLFAAPVSDVWLEIGFGGGEHLMARAKAHPEAGIIGCEPFVNGVAKLVGALAEHPLPNVRIHDGDALDVLAALPDASIARAYLLYPDPWPKRRHNKRRFVSPGTVKSLARVIRPGGHFFFASDIDHYVGWTLARVMASPDFTWTADRAVDWTQPFPGWPGTRYEAKALREGRKPSYLTFLRR